MTKIENEKTELINRTKKIIGQMKSVQSALEQDEHCSEILQRLAAARGSVNSLMAELMEEHIRNHMPRKNKVSVEAANDLIEIVRTYLR